MVALGTIRRSLTYFVALPFTVTLALLNPAHAEKPRVALPAEPVQNVPDLTDPNNVRPATQNDSLLSMQAGQRLMAEALSAVGSKNYTVAAKKLQDARIVFNQVSNFYQQLSSSFSGIDNRISESQRVKALESAQLRDEATYQLALVYRAQNQPELAVPLLIQIIRSENPTRDLGKKSYQQLLELGFVDTPFNLNTSDNQSTPASPPKK